MNQNCVRSAVRAALGESVTNTHRIGSAVISTALLASPVTFAQSTANSDDDSERLEEITVVGRKEFFRPTDASSATKFDLPIFETPQSITVLTDDFLETVQADDLLHIDKYVAGLVSYDTSNGFFGGSTMTARGFQFDFDNGFKINGFSTLSQFQPDMSMLERVEVVKGPTAIVYGVNNYGGVVNSITKKPLNDPSYVLSATYGSYDFMRIEADIGGPLNSNGSVNYRLTGAWHDQDFIKDHQTRERVSFMPSVEWNVSEQTTATATVLYQKEKTQYDEGFVLAEDENGSKSLPVGLDRENFYGLPGYTRLENEHLQAIGAVNHEFENGFTLSGHVGYTESDFASPTEVYIYNFFGPATATPYNEIYGLSPDALAAYVYNTNVNSGIETYDAELRFGGEFEAFGRNHKFLLNGEYRRIDRDDPLYTYVFLGLVDLYNPDFSFVDPSDPAFAAELAGFTLEKREILAVGGQVLFELSDAFSVMVGGRWTSSDIQFQDLRTLGGEVDPNFAPFETTFEETISHFIPRLGLMYGISDNINLYYSYTEGFIPQTGITRGEPVEYPSGVINYDNGPVLDPEEGVQHEIGVKSEFFGQALGVNLAIYDIERRNASADDPTNGQVFDPATGEVTGFESFVVAGREQTHRGAELEVFGRVADGLNIVATYAYQDSEITKDDNNPEVIGNPPWRAPEHTASILGTYEVLDGSMEGLSATLGYNYGGSYFSRSDSFRFEVPSRFSIDAFFAYDMSDSVTIDVAITNITDEDDIINNRGSRHSHYYHVAPRQVRGRLHVRF